MKSSFPKPDLRSWHRHLIGEVSPISISIFYVQTTQQGTLETNYISFISQLAKAVSLTEPIKAKIIKCTLLDSLPGCPGGGAPIGYPQQTLQYQWRYVILFYPLVAPPCNGVVNWTEVCHCFQKYCCPMVIYSYIMQSML